MSVNLNNKRVALLATDGVEQIELTVPRASLQDAGAKVDLVSLKAGDIDGYNHLTAADSFSVDKTLDDVSVDDYDALLLPGGVANPDALRADKQAVSFVRAFFEQQKPVAAICHGAWTIVEADMVRGRELTSWPSLQTDIRNAGGRWVDQEVCVDRGLVTSRKPDDLEAFCVQMKKTISEGRHAAV